MAMQITPATSWIHGARVDVEVWRLAVAAAPAAVDVSPTEEAERSGRLSEDMLYTPRQKICLPYTLIQTFFVIAADGK